MLRIHIAIAEKWEVVGTSNWKPEGEILFQNLEEQSRYLCCGAFDFRQLNLNFVRSSMYSAVIF